MKSITEFFKSCLIGGLFVILPLALFYLLLDQILQLLVAIATPIADLLPAGLFDEVKAPVFIAVILIVGASFVCGLLLRSVILQRLGRWIERMTVGRLPLYNAVKSLSKGLIGVREDDAFRSAILNSADGDREIVYVVEDHGNGQMTVLVPWAPASFAGSVKIMSSDRIELLDASLGDTSQVLGHWGVGARDLLARKAHTTHDQR